MKENAINGEEINQRSLVMGILNNQNLTNTRTIEDDTDLLISDKKNMVLHNKKYTKLLKAYVKNADITLKSKRKWKFCFFLYSLILLGIMTISIIVFSFIVYANSTNIVVDVFSISSVALSFLSSVIVIPNVITNYLFNQEEEKYMSEVISNLQDYDSLIREKGIN